jgi:hypothetical protein
VPSRMEETRLHELTPPDTRIEHEARSPPSARARTPRPAAGIATVRTPGRMIPARMNESGSDRTDRIVEQRIERALVGRITLSSRADP